ncbi:MAG: hypothetical protein M1132_00910 [Chloroflexi bacterium]|nr:hypothetical protein [Chloroflexota bacterium]
MDERVVTLVLGLAGIIATLLSSSLALYFAPKARSAPLREGLFNNQLDLISRMLFKVGRIRVFATMLVDKDNTFKDQARDDIGECVREYSEMQDEAAALLPAELWVEVKRLNDYLAEFLVCYDEGQQVDLNNLTNLSAMAAKVALLGRVVIGVDELTGESLSLISNRKNYERVANVGIDYFERMSNNANGAK